jgi:hypothetical protein
MIAQAVGHANRRRGVRHPDVDVQCARWRAGRQSAHVAGDPPVTLIVDVPYLAERLGRVDACPKKAGTDGNGGGAQVAQVLDGLRRGSAHRGGELEEGGVEVSACQGRLVAERASDISGTGVEGIVVLAHNEQFLLDADGERLAAAERRLFVADSGGRRLRY